MGRRGFGTVVLIAVLGCGPGTPDDAATTNAGTGADAGVDDADTGAVASTAETDPCEGPEPAAGCPGGQCLAPDGACDGVTCNQEMNYCYDPDDPCLGFACGGTDRGTCSPVDGLPTCTCNDEFESETFALYCCPVDGGDPFCV